MSREQDHISFFIFMNIMLNKKNISSIIVFRLKTEVCLYGAYIKKDYRDRFQSF